MAQKNKKQTRKTSAAVRSTVENDVSASSVAISSPAGNASVTGGRSFTSEFNPDYSQTIKDLKRIAILAGAFFIVLVALAFVLP